MLLAWKSCPYFIQMVSYFIISISRYWKLTSFFRLARINQARLRFSSVTLSKEHMIYFACRLRFVNLQRIFYGWTAPMRSKSRRWKRKFWVEDPNLTCQVLLTRSQFYNFWQTFLTMYVSHLTYKGFARRVGAGAGLLHWFVRSGMYWEYPYMWRFFNNNLPVHYELQSFFFQVYLSRFKRYSFMLDRDLYRLLNFPIHLFNLPRLWQEDPSKHVISLRRSFENN